MKIYILVAVLAAVAAFSIGYQLLPEPSQTEPTDGMANKTNETVCVPEILFGDDFEGYAEGSLANENWILTELSEVGNSEYTVKQLEDNKAMWLRLRGVGILTDALLTKKEFDNFTFEFNIHDDRPYDTVPAVVLRFDENGNYYLMTYNEYGASPGAVKVYRMPEKQLITSNRISITTLQDGKWHKFKIIANGTKIQAWVDDVVKLFEINSSIEKGRAGFGNSDGSLGSYYVDGVAVKSIC